MNSKTISTFLGLLALVILPLSLLYSTFAQSKDCDQLVIDTYEIHSGINIPKVSGINCYYDKKLDARISIYSLKESLDLAKFSSVNRSAGCNAFVMQGVLAKEEMPTADTLLLATGTKGDRKWAYLYEVETHRLWAELVY